MMMLIVKKNARRRQITIAATSPPLSPLDSVVSSTKKENLRILNYKNRMNSLKSACYIPLWPRTISKYNNHHELFTKWKRVAHTQYNGTIGKLRVELNWTALHHFQNCISTCEKAAPTE